MKNKKKNCPRNNSNEFINKILLYYSINLKLNQALEIIEGIKYDLERP